MGGVGLKVKFPPRQQKAWRYAGNHSAGERVKISISGLASSGQRTGLRF